MRLIDADALIDKYGDWYTEEGTEEGYIGTIKGIVDSMPTIEPEREKGEWEEIEVIPEAYDIAGVKTWASKMRCNQCGFTTFAIEGRFAQYNFCPNCGVDTRGKQDE